MKDFVAQAKSRDDQDSYKVVVLFNSVSDSLFSNDQANANQAQMVNLELASNDENGRGGAAATGNLPTTQDLQKFQIALTLEYEFDYLEVYTPMEVIDFLKEMHFSIVDKPFRKELSMYSRKGFRPGKKAQLQGFTDTLSLTYISFLMCVPGVSENKAIAIAKEFPTLDSLLNVLQDGRSPEKARK